jgi:CRISPR-associated protein Csa5
MRSIDIIAEILGFLVAEGNYSYVDKVGQAPSGDLLIFYLKEALRDFHSLARGDLKNVDKDELCKFLEDIAEGKNNPDWALNDIAKTVHEGGPKKLREVCSLISAKALAKSLKFIRCNKEKEGEGE